MMSEERMINHIKKDVIKEFFDPEKVKSIAKYGTGHINYTYIVEFSDVRYILQMINTTVFENPFGVMHNIEYVTKHIRSNIIYEGKNPHKTVLNTVLTRYNQLMAIVPVGDVDEYWRCFEFIEGGKTYDKIESPAMFLEVGRVVGGFQKLLQGFHTRIIVDNIKCFHDTPYRYNKFLDTCKIDRFDRVKECKKEIEFINNHKDIIGIITSKLASHEIPRRVTHNDTKLSNVMIDEKTGKGLCLIDFDTVMKGSLLYDYGDALRLGASNALEDEVDLKKVTINLKLFEAFTRGFLEEIKPIITDSEIDNLYYGYIIITLEVGMRFLDDYLNGDTYFRIDPNRPKHNLERAKNQLKLVEDIEKNHISIQKIIDKLLKELAYSAR